MHEYNTGFVFPSNSPICTGILSIHCFPLEYLWLAHFDSFKAVDGMVLIP